MKMHNLFLVSLILSIYGCTQTTDCNGLLLQIEKNLPAGNLKEAVILADSLKKICPDETRLVHKADSLAQIAERIGIDFSLTEEQVTSRLGKGLPGFSPEDKTLWEDLNWLEWRTIDGEKRYFNRAASNLGLIRNFHLHRAERDSLIANDKLILFRKKHTENIINFSDIQALPVVPVAMTIDYTITVEADAVPAGEIVRCWMPWPKESHPGQQKVKLISASRADYEIAPDSAIHRTVYMEEKTEKGVPLVFNVSYSYESSGQYFDMKNLKIKPYDKTSSLYKKYTSEQLPHICFTDRIKQLTDSITGSEENPAENVRKIYYWFNKNIPWAGALEYSIMP
ncbi:MAG: hypothetical protein C0408_11350, partial [Odoribacter sp.]|nr:hypothetical protein [Odoribacter sp.]